MRPQNKFQQGLIELSATLTNQEYTLKKWAFETCIEHKGFRTKKNTSCMSCGHIYVGSQEVTTEECPSCKRMLTVSQKRHKKDSQEVYFCTLDVVNEYQLIRHFRVTHHITAGEEPRFYVSEIIQHWMHQTKNGLETELIARQACSAFYRINWGGNLEIRNKKQIDEKYDCCPHFTHPDYKVWDVLVRNGFKGDFGYTTPRDLFFGLINSPRIETLHKAGQQALASAGLNESRVKYIDKYWHTIKICMRNNYIVPMETRNDWFDYLELCRWFNLDILNPKYACPADIKAAHDALVARKRADDIRRREAREKESKELAQRWKEQGEQLYAEAKGAFFGLVFQDKSLTIKVLESIKEFMEEANAHGHCLYTNEYFKKADSLIFSAKVNGQPAETVEVTLSDMKINQSRGLVADDPNGTTKYHMKIINLVRRNMPVIQKRMKEAKKHNAVEIAA